MIDEVKEGVVHDPFAKGRCSTCHDHHASDYSNQLLEPVRENCFRCHGDLESAAKNRRVIHEPFDEGDCISCHNPHGSKIQGQLYRPAASLCLSCHDDLADDLANLEVLHVPAEAGRCLTCHTTHYSDTENMLVTSGATLCKECHDTGDPAAVEAHHNISVAQADCSGCHEAHAAIHQGLLHRVIHDPFRKGNCSECH
jgi:predicted CXXCH cytochrome family protein